ncbi:MAG TPA: HIT domain-containing protein [Thermoanaerobaculia bacterium]
MKDEGCAFCGAGSGELVFDFGDWSLWLHPDSAVAGHAMLAIKRHVENFADLTDSEATQFVRVQKVVERALLDVTKTDRAILLKLGIQTPHLHVHIYPVRSAATREDVMRILDGTVSENRPAGFVKSLRDRIFHLT